MHICVCQTRTHTHFLLVFSGLGSLYEYTYGYRIVRICLWTKWSLLQGWGLVNSQSVCVWVCVYVFSKQKNTTSSSVRSIRENKTNSTLLLYFESIFFFDFLTQNRLYYYYNYCIITLTLLIIWFWESNKRKHKRCKRCSVCVCVRERERERVCVCVSKCVPIYSKHDLWKFLRTSEFSGTIDIIRSRRFNWFNQSRISGKQQMVFCKCRTWQYRG